MKKFLLIASVALYAAFSNTAYAATDFYDARSRTISVKFEQPVESVSVHIIGKAHGKCLPAKSAVYVMNFVPAQSVKSDRKLSVGLGLKSKKASGEIAASSADSATSETPAVFSYNYTGLIRELHYNIVYTRGGTQYALGWRPDSDGGCTYEIP